MPKLKMPLAREPSDPLDETEARGRFGRLPAEFVRISLSRLFERLPLILILRRASVVDIDLLVNRNVSTKSTPIWES